jgi:hypothetical protein
MVGAEGFEPPTLCSQSGPGFARFHILQRSHQGPDRRGQSKSDLIGYEMAT